MNVHECLKFPGHQNILLSLYGHGALVASRSSAICGHIVFDAFLDNLHSRYRAAGQGTLLFL